ncbi:MAG: hypothetical protein WC648_02965 [Candidatus Paceibacterota bacterium]|jgi:hypothetical protein
MTNQFELIFIFASVIIGVISAAYFYISSGIFMDSLKKPLRLVAGGVFIIAIAILMAAFVSFESSQGVAVSIYGLPMSALFYIFHIIGSILVVSGSRKFTHRAEPVVSAV